MADNSTNSDPKKNAEETPPKKGEPKGMTPEKAKKLGLDPKVYGGK